MINLLIVAYTTQSLASKPIIHKMIVPVSLVWYG